MSKSKFLSVSLLALICAAGPAATRLSAQPSEAPAPGAAGGDKPADAPADKAGEKPAGEAAPASPRSPDLAVRYAALAQETLRQKNVVLPHFRQAAALITAAMRLDPVEPR
jgi:hypothetical protein